jgi:hypothetical protein
MLLQVSVDIVAIVQPYDATVARLLSVDHRRSHHNNQQHGSD